METEIRKQIRGGKGDVQIKHVFQQSELRGKCRLLARIALGPGCSIGLHAHDQEEEIYYILSGNGRVVDDGVESEVSAGDAVITGGGKQHSIENVGEDDLELMATILLF